MPTFYASLLTYHILSRDGVMVFNFQAWHKSWGRISHSPVFSLSLVSVGLLMCKPDRVCPVPVYSPLPLSRILIAHPTVVTEQKTLPTPSHSSP